MKRPAFVIPYRNRQRYLEVLLACLPRYLESSGIEGFRIYVAEQGDAEPFRLALARNVGARFALEDGCDYLVFHDVDIVPLRNVDYRLGGNNVTWFANAGSSKLHAESFLRVNGYNPRFAGWGCEDTDLIHRLHFYGERVDHWPSLEEARFAVMLNLEMAPMTERDARALSERYFGYQGEGPLFLSYCEERPGEPPRALVERYSKADFFDQRQKAWSQAVLARILAMPAEERRAYYQEHGVRQLDMSTVEVVGREGPIVRLRFDALRSGGAAEMPPASFVAPEAAPARPPPVTIWKLEDARTQHHSSPGLGAALAEILPRERPVLDLGCGVGHYLAELQRRGYRCLGVEGTPDIGRIAEFPHIVQADLSRPLSLDWPASSVLCLEVGEHLLPEQEGTLLDNLARHCADWLVLSWALPGQPGHGHNNCRSNEYIIAQMSRRGFVYLEDVSRHLREAATRDGATPWFRDTIMVFRDARGLLARPPARQ